MHWLRNIFIKVFRGALQCPVGHAILRDTVGDSNGLTIVIVL